MDNLSRLRRETAFIFNLPNEKDRRYRRVAVGGTLDIIHLGHESLLKTAFKVGEKVIIGLSTDRLAEELKKHHIVSPFHERKAGILRFLKENALLERAEIVSIDDRYGTTIEDRGLEALVVSRETSKVADQINYLRIRKGLKPLDIIVVETVKAKNGKPISTSRIKKGEINRYGELLSR